MLPTGIVLVKNGAPEGSPCYNEYTVSKEKMMQEDYGDMDVEDFTHGLFHNLKSVKVALWILVALEIVNVISK